MKKLIAKIYCPEGVIFEKKYETEAEANAFVEGFRATKEAIDSDDDYTEACTDENPSEDCE